MNKIGMVLLGALLAMVMASEAKATVAVSSFSAAGVQTIAAPAAGKKNYIKSITLGNDNAAALCVLIKDGTTTKLMLCAGAQGTVTWPSGVAGLEASASGTSGPVSKFLGEDLTFSGAFNVTSATASAAAIGGAVLTVTYNTK